MTPDDTARQLDKAIIAAHGHDDRPGLVDLYARAADIASDLDTKCFFLTQAYVFALETGHPATDDLRRRLEHHGRL